MTQDELKLLLRYEPDTGLFFWRSNKGTAKAGDVAGTKATNGYINICIKRKLYKAHRLAWLYIHGCNTEQCIDNIKGAKDDNRLANLRQATHRENSQNHVLLGACFVKGKNKWRASIRFDNKRVHLGYFESMNEARQAYLQAKKEHHKFQPIQRSAT